MSEPEPAVGPGAERAGGARQAVVATAGHVDHGKSSLILRLTGMDPDRLAEERRRGLTIELGYAWTTLPSGLEIGFVDVPGHERFVRTMLAGVGPVRLVLFVVAADEGWKPQSEEHLAIVDRLGVDGAVVALTKRDLVDERRLHDTEAEVRERLAGTAAEGAPVIACSARTGEGLDALAEALDALVAAAPAPSEDGRVRLFVDRIFSMRGAGTVVTGTLTGGPLALGDEVELLPSGVTARIRRLQTHRRDVEVAHPVSRVAVNLSAERGPIERGEILTRPGAWRPTEVLEARIAPIRSLGAPLGPRGAFKLYAGAAERDARLRLLEVQAVGNEGAFARIALSAPLVVDVGDRFVLRESGRRATVAGGVVLDAHPPKRPGPDAVRRLTVRHAADRAELPAILLAERRAVPARTLELELGVSPEAVAGGVRVGGWWVSDDVLEAARGALGADLAAFHAADPVAAGRDVVEVRRRLVEALGSTGAPRDPDLATAVIHRQVADGILVQEGSRIRLAEHEPRGGEQERRLVTMVAEAEPTPPNVGELRDAGFTRSQLDAVVRSGELVRVSDEIVVTSAFVERAKAAIVEAGDAGITVSALRERLGTTRKYAVPLLEHFDRAGITRRSGDVRLLRRSAAERTRDG